MVMRYDYRKYLRPVRMGELAETFPYECKYAIKFIIPELKNELEPYYNFIQRVRYSDLPDDTKRFWVRVCEVVYMPKKKVNYLKQLQVLARVMNKTTKGITDADIEQAKAVDIFTLHDFRKRKGKTACCPFHEDKTPSFSVRGNRWVCFAGCGKGDSIDFYMKLHGVPFYKAVKELCDHG